MTNQLTRKEGFRAAELALTGDRAEALDAFQITEAELDHWIALYVRR